MNIGRILLTKKSLLTGRRYSHLSKKMKKKTNKESQRRKLIRKRSSKEKNMVQKLYDTCKEVFASGKAGYVPPPSDIHRLKSVLGMYIYILLLLPYKFINIEIYENTKQQLRL